MSIRIPVEIRPITSADHAAWLPLWQSYQRFYMTRDCRRHQRHHLATLPRPRRADARGAGLARGQSHRPGALDLPPLDLDQR